MKKGLKKFSRLETRLDDQHADIFRLLDIFKQCDTADTTLISQALVILESSSLKSTFFDLPHSIACYISALILLIRNPLFDINVETLIMHMFEAIPKNKRRDCLQNNILALLIACFESRKFQSVALQQQLMLFIEWLVDENLQFYTHPDTLALLNVMCIQCNAFRSNLQISVAYNRLLVKMIGILVARYPPTPIRTETSRVCLFFHFVASPENPNEGRIYTFMFDRDTGRGDWVDAVLEYLKDSVLMSVEQLFGAFSVQTYLLLATGLQLVLMSCGIACVDRSNHLCDDESCDIVELKSGEISTQCAFCGKCCGSTSQCKNHIVNECYGQQMSPQMIVDFEKIANKIPS